MKKLVLTLLVAAFSVPVMAQDKCELSVIESREVIIQKDVKDITRVDVEILLTAYSCLLDHLPGDTGKVDPVVAYYASNDRYLKEQLEAKASDLGLLNNALLLCHAKLQVEEYIDITFRDAFLMLDRAIIYHSSVCYDHASQLFKRIAVVAETNPEVVDSKKLMLLNSRCSKAYKELAKTEKDKLEPVEQEKIY